MEKYNYFATLAQKKRLGVEDKRAIKEEAYDLGITLNEKCPDCYADAAMEIALHYKPKPETPKGAHYELCDGIDITLHSFKFGTMRICQKYCTDANVKRWIEAGIPMRFFKTIPDASNGED